MKGLIAEKWSKFIHFPVFGRRKSKFCPKCTSFLHAPQFGLELDNKFSAVGWDSGLAALVPRACWHHGRTLLPAAWCSEGCW